VKILLLNNNPVVNKLVTLSAQKTSDELDVVSSIDEIENTKYNLIVVDDTLYTSELFDELNGKITFQKSLYICARDADEVDEFSSVLKKPFLPTDLVDLFARLGKEANTVKLDEIKADDEMNFEDELEDELSFDDEISLDTDELNLDDDLVLDDELSFDDTEVSDLAVDDEDYMFSDLDVDEIIKDELFDNNAVALDAKSLGILDEDDLQEVQDLYSEINEDTKDSEELSLDDEEIEDDLDIESMVDDVVEEEVEEEITDELLEEVEPEVDEELEPEVDELLEEVELEAEEDFTEELEPELEDEVVLEEEVVDEPNLEEVEQIKDEPLEDLEQQIQDAVGELSQDDLDSEVDEETLLNIVTGDIDSLSSRDFKLALGEEVEDIIEPEEVEEIIESEEIEDIEDDMSPKESELVDDELVDLDSDDVQEESEDKNITALKTLLEALNDKDVVASLKGAKININITIG